MKCLSRKIVKVRKASSGTSKNSVAYIEKETPLGTLKWDITIIENISFLNPKKYIHVHS